MKRLRTRNHIPFELSDLDIRGARIFRELLLRLDGVPYVVGFGTALGLHRDGRLIPTDTDLDVNIQLSEVDQVRERLADWPLARERYRNTDRHSDLRQLIWYPDEVIVDVMLWRPNNTGYGYERFTLGPDGFTPDWRETDYGWVPLPGGVESHMEDLFGETWRIPQYRRKPV